jgi:hypothetical protein
MKRTAEKKEENVMDEQIARLAAERQETERDAGIQGGGIRINGKLLAFEQTELFDGKLLVRLPSDFADMPEEIAKVKYPSSDRPKIIISDERGAATFTFGVVDGPLDEESAPELAAQMRTMLQRLNPSYLFFDADETETEGKPARSLEYKSPALDGTLYNLMCFAPLCGKTLMCTFCCPYEEREEWRPVASEIFDRMEISDKEEKDA